MFHDFIFYFSLILSQLHIKCIFFSNLSLFQSYLSLDYYIQVHHLSISKSTLMDSIFYHIVFTYWKKVLICYKISAKWILFVESNLKFPTYNKCYYEKSWTKDGNGTSEAKQKFCRSLLSAVIKWKTIIFNNSRIY